MPLTEHREGEGGGLGGEAKSLIVTPCSDTLLGAEPRWE